jgi:hypothetical protein
MNQEIIKKTQLIVGSVIKGSSKICCVDCEATLTDSILGVYTHLLKECPGRFITCEMCSAEMDRDTFKIHWAAHEIQFFGNVILTVQKVASIELQDRLIHLRNELLEFTTAHSQQAIGKLQTQLLLEQKEQVPPTIVEAQKSPLSENCQIIERNDGRVSKRKRFKQEEEASQTQLYTNTIDLIDSQFFDL